MAQLVARTAGGREVAGSSPVTLTMVLFGKLVLLYGRVLGTMSVSIMHTLTKGIGRLFLSKRNHSKQNHGSTRRTRKTIASI